MRLKEHLIQYISGATGGPTQFAGKDLVTTHEHMSITNTQFDAFLDDLQQSMKAVGLGEREQTDLLPIIERTREFIVEQDSKP